MQQQLDRFGRAVCQPVPMNVLKWRVPGSIADVLLHNFVDNWYWPIDVWCDVTRYDVEFINSTLQRDRQSVCTTGGRVYVYMGRWLAMKVGHRPSSPMLTRSVHLYQGYTVLQRRGWSGDWILRDQYVWLMRIYIVRKHRKISLDDVGTVGVNLMGYKKSCYYQIVVTHKSINCLGTDDHPFISPKALTSPFV